MELVWKSQECYIDFLLVGGSGIIGRMGRGVLSSSSGGAGVQHFLLLLQIIHTSVVVCMHESDGNGYISELSGSLFTPHLLWVKEGGQKETKGYMSGMSTLFSLLLCCNQHSSSPFEMQNQHGFNFGGRQPYLTGEQA